jgi:transposase InsO family protein
MAARREADVAWRQARQELLNEEAQAKAVLPPVLTWIAILVVIDNCTRRCLGLASFAAGVHVTADSVVAALRLWLPAGLQFVISDNGAQFRSEAFASLASSAQFVHVRIAPYRARTNGIAERFVRTLKEWLEAHAWSGPDDMPAILAQMQTDYDDRPHQARELQGLSPNEYDRRQRLGATC